MKLQGLSIYVVNPMPYYPIEVFANWQDAKNYCDKIGKEMGWEMEGDSYIKPNGYTLSPEDKYIQ